MMSQVYIEKPLGVETHDRQALYELRRNPWVRRYSYIRSLKID